MNDASAGSETRIPLELIEPNPWQVRLSEDDEAVEKLAISIEANGLMQVPTARPSTVKRQDGKYGWQLAFGHTRFAAFKHLAAQGKAEYESMPLVIRELTDQQMFERAVAENVQRRDLTPIEEAQAMRRAMDDFKLSSAQVGELFGVAAETVRGKVRLLKLPKAVRAMVQRGELNEGVSRALVSAAKVMKPEQLQETATLIARGVYEVEEAGELIAQQMQTILHEMWHRYNKGEDPRGGPELWPLSWKPNGLPPMTPAAVVHQLKLAMKPDQIAGFVEALNLGQEFQGTASDDPEARQKIQVLVSPPACTECPLYVQLNGSHFCGLKACWERKQRAWAQQEFNRLVRDLDIPAYANKEKDGDFRRHDWNSRREFIELVKAKDPDLRLVATPKAQRADEITGSRFACVVDLNSKRVKKEAARDGRRASVSTSITPSAAAKMKKDVEEREWRQKLGEASEKFVEQAAVPVFAQAFKPLANATVLRFLCERASEIFTYNPRKRRTATELREVLSGALLTEDLFGPPVLLGNEDLEEGPLHVARLLQKAAPEWGVKLRADWLGQAERFMPKQPKKEPTAKDAASTKRKPKAPRTSLEGRLAAAARKSVKPKEKGRR